MVIWGWEMMWIRAVGGVAFGCVGHLGLLSIFVLLVDCLRTYRHFVHLGLEFELDKASGSVGSL